MIYCFTVAWVLLVFWKPCLLGSYCRGDREGGHGKHRCWAGCMLPASPGSVVFDEVHRHMLTDGSKQVKCGFQV